uniref:Peptidase S11 D-alanyl-D-alanine carboxypeptidase A N-terminal domain-containing protein n=1 Tax=Streptomyces sp. NBC_00049 TaxID=2903617 RepID=A0AAU2JR01_9ACTN
MAGESPDKSVDEETPGAVESSAARDPRLSVFRPRDPEEASGDSSDAAAGSGSRADADGASGDGASADAAKGTAANGTAKRDPLRDAVAAWVASAEGADADAGADPGADSDTGSAAESVREPAASSGRVEPDAPAAAAADRVAAADRAAEKPVAEKPAAEKPAAEKPAAVARPAASESAAAREAAPISDSVSAPERARAAEPAQPVDSERTAVFRAVRPGSAPGSAPAADGKPAAPAPDAPASTPTPPAASPKDSASAPADSERTAVFRAVRPPAPEQPATPAPESADSERTAVFRAPKLDSASGPAKGAPAAEPADSERTAVFRAVKPGSGSGSAPGADRKPVAPAADPAAAAPASGARPTDSASEPADSERTAVFRAPKLDSASGPAKGAAPAAEAADSERTAVFRAVKPGSGSVPPKASTFVPLRTDEAGQPPKAPTPGPPVPGAPVPGAPRPPKPPVPAPAPAPAASSSATAPTVRAPGGVDRSERTTQQPLPPLPPLDMLADLTNNPPPPPSPLRTAVRRFKIYAPIVVLLAIIIAVVQLVRPLPEPSLVMTSKSSYTFDGSKPELPWPSEGQAYMAAAGLGTLGQSGEQKPVPIASVTKSMTAYIILRDHPIKKGEKGEMIEIDKTAETEGKKNNATDNESTLDTVKEGDKLTEYDAIAALMIPSANNIARLLARWDAGSQEAFVKKMNDTAKELGMSKTTYTDPSGLDATTVSTAEDQVKLGLKLVEMETLLEITKKPSWIDPYGKTWRNWNGLVPANDSLGIKTGTTTKAGGNLLFAAQKKIGKTNQLIVGAVLGQHKAPIIDSVIAASKQLMLATQKSLEGAPVVKKGEIVGHVDDGLGGRTPVVATADVQAVGWATLTVDVKLAEGGKLPQTAKAGTEVGVLTVGEGASQVKVPVALQSDLTAPTLGSKLSRIG